MCGFISLWKHFMILVIVSVAGRLFLRHATLFYLGSGTISDYLKQVGISECSCEKYDDAWEYLCQPIHTARDDTTRGSIGPVVFSGFTLRKADFTSPNATFGTGAAVNGGVGDIVPLTYGSKWAVNAFSSWATVQRYCPCSVCSPVSRPCPATIFRYPFYCFGTSAWTRIHSWHPR